MKPELRASNASALRRQLVTLFDGLDEERQRTLFEFAEFLVARSTPRPSAAIVPMRAADETVFHAVRRLNATYPALERHRLLEPVGQLLSQHMVDGRPKNEIIDELEALYARTYADLAVGR